MTDAIDMEPITSLEYGYGVSPSVMIMGVHDPRVNSGVFIGSYKGDSFTTILNSIIPENVLNLLVRAINNRTVERNYFRLYSQFLEGNLSEEAFDKEIELHEEDYVITTEKKPQIEDVRAILRIADKIKDLNSSSDLSLLFSFDPDETDRVLALPEITDGNI